MDLGHWKPRRRRSVRPDVMSLESRQVLSHVSPAALVHHPAAHVVRLGSTQAKTIDFVGKIDGSALFLPNGYHHPDESQVVFRASGQLDAATSPRLLGPFQVDDRYHTFDGATRPFFNGPSATPFDFTMRFRNGRTLPVDGVILAAAPDGTDISFLFRGTIKSEDGHRAAGEIQASGVYQFSGGRGVIYSSGPFQATLTGTINPSMV